jgi:hypothetical protein
MPSSNGLPPAETGIYLLPFFPLSICEARRQRERGVKGAKFQTDAADRREAIGASKTKTGLTLRLTMTAEWPPGADVTTQFFGIAGPEINNRIRPLRARIPMAKPFGRLVRFEREESCHRPRVLLIAPLSGHRAILLYDMIVALAQDHDLHLVEWEDASQVALSAGAFRHWREYRLSHGFSCAFSARIFT